MQQKNKLTNICTSLYKLNVPYYPFSSNKPQPTFKCTYSKLPHTNVPVHQLKLQTKSHSSEINFSVT